MYLKKAEGILRETSVQSFFQSLREIRDGEEVHIPIPADRLRLSGQPQLAGATASLRSESNEDQFLGV